MAAINTLSDKAIKAAIKQAEEAGKPQTVNDGGGLLMIARPEGVGWWRLRYWMATRENRLSLGVYPEVTLAMARQRRDEAKRQIAEGVDPSEARKAGKAAQEQARTVERLQEAGEPLPGTFEAVAREWWSTVHSAKVSEGHAARTLIRLEQDAFPWIGARPIADLRAADVLACAQRVVQRGAIETAHRLKDACGQVFRYGVATSACERNPVVDLRDALPPVPARHLAALTDPEEVAKLLRAMDGYHGHPVTRFGLLLSPLLFLRPGELRHLEWGWINWDDSALTVPSELMKRKRADKATGQPHWVPLSTQAQALLRELQPLTGQGRYLFPSLTSSQRAMSENTVRSALRRLGYGNDDMTAHGFRAMARTMAVERLGIAAEVVEAQLAHAVGDALGRAYNRTQFLAQRRELMQVWADYLDRLKAGGEVLPFKAA
jgi:integrase